MTTEAPTFLGEPPATDDAVRLYGDQRDSDGYVWNLTRLWCWRTDTFEGFVKVRNGLMSGSTLTDRDWAVMVTAMASTLGDSYCSLAWGPKLAKLSDADTAADVIRGVAQPARLDAREAALAAWARQLVRDPNGTTTADVDALRAVGLDDREIFEATAFVGLRLAFSTVNDALGVCPDQQLAAAAPESVRAAVGYGRPAGVEPSRP